MNDSIDLFTKNTLKKLELETEKGVRRKVQKKSETRWGRGSKIKLKMERGRAEETKII